jgi:hypothetical protein
LGEEYRSINSSLSIPPLCFLKTIVLCGINLVRYGLYYFGSFFNGVVSAAWVMRRRITG